MTTLVTFRMVENVTICQDGISLTQISLLANLIPEIDFLDQGEPHAAKDPIFYIGEFFTSFQMQTCFRKFSPNFFLFIKGSLTKHGIFESQPLITPKTKDPKTTKMRSA